jgi:hypothetical protein
VGFAGLLGFVTIVLALHCLQPEYDARRQLVSELALGPYGWAMMPAFVALALSLLGVQHGLGALGVPVAPRALLGAAAAGMLVAGLFPLGRATVLHVVAVAVGFTLIALAVYLLQVRAGALQSRASRAGSWLLGAGAVVSLASASCGVPLGVAQRLATACVLGWLCLLSRRLIQG